MSSKNLRRETIQRHLAMRLGDDTYTCDLHCIQEIVSNPVLDPSFDGTELLVGMYEGSRGSIPVVDLLARTPDDCPICHMSLVIFERAGKVAGLLADNLLDVVEFDPAFVIPLRKPAGEIHHQYLSGRVRVKGSDYYLIDLDKVVVDHVNTLMAASTGDGRGAQIKGL
jgi:chemotaxis signal transduction protein